MIVGSYITLECDLKYLAILLQDFQFIQSANRSKKELWHLIASTLVIDLCHHLSTKIASHSVTISWSFFTLTLPSNAKCSPPPAHIYIMRMVMEFIYQASIAALFQTRLLIYLPTLSLTDL